MTMKKLILSILTTLAVLPVLAANKYDNPDTLFVSRDGTCEFRTIDEAIEVCRAFMDYTKVIYVKKGVYKEKLIIPSWLTHITICGEDRDQTIITWDDHANIKMPTGGLDSEAAVKGKPIGTFRTYTLKVQGSYITLKNITIENNAARLGQAVALHTEGDHILVQNCRLLGNQDTVYTGVAGTRIPSTTATSREQQTSSSVLPSPGSRTAKSTVSPTAISQPRLHQPVSSMATCSISAASPPRPRPHRSIWAVHGVHTPTHSSSTAKWAAISVL